MMRALLAALVFSACGTPTAPPSAAPASSAAPEPSALPAPSASPALPEASARPASSETPAASAEPPADSPPDKSPREVKYLMAGGKLEVVIGGVRFKPSAKAVRVGGGWGVKLSVSSEAEDDKMHSLLAGKAGALALGGTVHRKGKTEELEDQRDGDEEVFVTPGTPTKIEREWPGKGKAKPLAQGDKLELRVGLWGFGPDAASRRPVKKFLILSMTVGKGEPRPLIAPPK